MEFKEFLEKYYYGRMSKKAYRLKLKIIPLVHLIDDFPEALKNYEKHRKEELQVLIDKICEKQRKNCQADWWAIDGRSMLESKQHKIESL